MPFWPWYMAACVALILWGCRTGANLFVPVVILCGFIAMRFVVLMPEGWREIAAFIPWLCVSAILMYNKEWVPGFLCLLSGAVYPVLLTLGLKIEHLGLVPIIADPLALAALGFWGLAVYSHTNRNCARVGGNGLYAAEIMAKGESVHHAVAWRGAKIKAGR